MNRIVLGVFALALVAVGCNQPVPPVDPPVTPTPAPPKTPDPVVPPKPPVEPAPVPDPGPKLPDPKPEPEPEPVPRPEPVRPKKGDPLRPSAPPLPEPAGDVVTVDNAAKLYAAATRVRPGGTILLADGNYNLTQTLYLDKDRVTLRGKSGDRTKVVLDGGGTLQEAIVVTNCADATIADLTLQNVRWNGIKIDHGNGVQRMRIYNCVLKNIWQRAVKGVAVPEAGRDRTRPRDCRIEFCLFENDRPKKFGDDPTDHVGTFNGDYIAGIDVMGPAGWVIRDNVFRGVRGRTGQGRGAVFLWVDARDCVVERNVIVDCDAGVCLGNNTRDPRVPTHCTGCVVRNNCVTRAPEGGIVAIYTRDCKILHNTICDTTGKAERGVRVVHATEGLVIANNLLAGPKLVFETPDRPDSRGNREGVAATVFLDPAVGDLRLAERAEWVVDGGKALPEVPEDIDGRRRGKRVDLGAHEYDPE